MADCKLHPGVPAAGRCAACAEEFCQNCLVDIQGQTFCSACKVTALQGKIPTAAVAAAEVKKGSNGSAIGSLILGIVSLFICGLPFGIAAISLGIQARKRISQNPNLGGGGLAIAGIVLGILGLVGWVIVRAMTAGNMFH